MLPHFFLECLSLYLSQLHAAMAAAAATTVTTTATAPTTATTHSTTPTTTTATVNPTPPTTCVLQSTACAISLCPLPSLTPFNPHSNLQTRSIIPILQTRLVHAQSFILLLESRFLCQSLLHPGKALKQRWPWAQLKSRQWWMPHFAQGSAGAGFSDRRGVGAETGREES